MKNEKVLLGFNMTREELDRLVEQSTVDCDASRRLEAMTQEEKEALYFPQSAPRSRPTTTPRDD